MDNLCKLWAFHLRYTHTHTYIQEHIYSHIQEHSSRLSSHAHMYTFGFSLSLSQRMTAGCHFLTKHTSLTHTHTHTLFLSPTSSCVMYTYIRALYSRWRGKTALNSHRTVSLFPFLLLLLLLLLLRDVLFCFRRTSSYLVENHQRPRHA